MDDTTTTVITEDDETINLDAEVTVTFTVSRTHQIDGVAVRQIIADLADAARNDYQGRVALVEPDVDEVDLSDPTAYVLALLNDNVDLQYTVLAKWADGHQTNIEDEEITVEEVV